MKKFLFVLFLAVLGVYSVFSMGAAPSAYDSYSSPPMDGSWMSFLLFPLIVIILVAIGGKNIGGQVLVLKRFNLNENEDEFLKIEGRASGILSWILSLCGIDPITSLSCNKQSIKFEETSIRYGKKTLNIPLVAVTGVSSGINKPFGLLVFGIIFALGGIITAIVTKSAGLFIPGLIVGILFMVFYVLMKTMVFSIYNGGDKPIATIRMKKSIIEGQSIDEQKYESAANSLSKAVLEIHHVLANTNMNANPEKLLKGNSSLSSGKEKSEPSISEASIIDRKQNAFHNIGCEAIIKNRTTLFEEPNYKSKIVCDLLVGETVVLLDKKEISSIIWYNVKDKEKNEGWCILNYTG